MGSNSNINAIFNSGISERFRNITLNKAAQITLLVNKELKNITPTFSFEDAELRQIN